jgi:hypothetical protein
MVIYGLRLTVSYVIQCVWADLYQVHGKEEVAPCAFPGVGRLVSVARHCPSLTMNIERS